MHSTMITFAWPIIMVVGLAAWTLGFGMGRAAVNPGTQADPGQP